MGCVHKWTSDRAHFHILFASLWQGTQLSSVFQKGHGRLRVPLPHLVLSTKRPLMSGRTLILVGHRRLVGLLRFSVELRSDIFTLITRGGLVRGKDDCERTACPTAPPIIEASPSFSAPYRGGAVEAPRTIP